MTRFSNQETLLGSLDILNSKILVVGVGGIGCELLKNLVMVGFKKITVIDLDTIDLSNLNRQFLFQNKHIKQPKATIAAQVAQSFNPNVSIEPHFSSIFDEKYTVEWFKSFDIVLNGLDNLAARSHVNLMCLASNVPLIESGTAGYFGQVTIHLKNKTKCFDCDVKETPKTFPVCTIRSTPSQPIHCIVWAKSYLFNMLFGEDDDDSIIDTSSTLENQQQIEKLAVEAKETKNILKLLGTEEFGPLFFKKIFHDDIISLCEMEEMWIEKKKPIPLSTPSLINEPSPNGINRDQTLWSFSFLYQIFISSINNLYKSLEKHRKTNPNFSLKFDKDDNDALDFVTSVSNLRCLSFGIQQQTRFKVKEISGNIIPAIATTNACIAGIIVLQAIKVLRSPTECRDTFLKYTSNRDNYLVPNELMPPNPNCSVCQVNYFSIQLNTRTKTLIEFFNHLRTQTQFKGDITLSTNNQSNSIDSFRLIYDSDDSELEDNDDKTFYEMGLVNQSKIIVTFCHLNQNQTVFLFFVVESNDNRIKIVGDLNHLVVKVEKSDEKDSELSKKENNELSNEESKEENKELSNELIGEKRKAVDDHYDSDSKKQFIQLDDEDEDIVLIE